MQIKQKIKLSLITMALLTSSIYAQDEQKKEETNQLEDVTVIEKSDITENSDSYIISNMSSATKMDLSILDTPQSVSVVTSQQMEDFGLTSLADSLNIATGIEVQKVESSRTAYFSRGLSITNILTDGVGGGLSSGEYQNGNIDMALYDHIEVTRGATSLTSNAGEPSATINLIRKKPTKETQAEIKATVGSWNKKRLEGDISGSISEDGSLRARVIGAVETSESYKDRFESESNTFGIILEKDISDNTTITAGISRSEDDNDGAELGGITTYDSNLDIYDMSTTTAAEWAYRDVTTTEAYATVNTILDNDWKFRTELSHKIIKQDVLASYMEGDSSGTKIWYYDKVEEDIESNSVDISANNTYTLNGKEHDFIMGANYLQQDYIEYTYYDYSDQGTYIDLETWDGSDVSLSFSDTPDDTDDWRLTEKSIYFATKFNILDDLSLIAGVKAATYKKTGLTSNSDFNAEDSAILPYASLLYKINEKLSTYASYTTTYNSNDESQDIDGNYLDPETGTNMEIGIKSELIEDKLNFAFSLYRVNQYNVANWAGWDSSIGSYYESIDGIETNGFDVELNGSPTDKINASIGYTHLMSVKDNDGENANKYIPRRTLKTSVTYEPNNNTKIGASANHKSRTDHWTTQSAYTIYNLMGSYNINKQTKISVNLNNITDEEYYNSTYKWYVNYGDPRNYEVTLAYKF